MKIFSNIISDFYLNIINRFYPNIINRFYSKQSVKHVIKNVVYDYKDINIPLRTKVILKIPKGYIDSSKIGYIEFWSKIAYELRNLKLVSFFPSEPPEINRPTTAYYSFNGLPPNVILNTHTIISISNADETMMHGENQEIIDKLNELLSSCTNYSYLSNQNFPVHLNFDDESVISQKKFKPNIDLFAIVIKTKEKIYVNFLCDDENKATEIFNRTHKDIFK